MIKLYFIILFTKIINKNDVVSLGVRKEVTNHFKDMKLSRLIEFGLPRVPLL